MPANQAEKPTAHNAASNLRLDRSPGPYNRRPGPTQASICSSGVILIRDLTPQRTAAHERLTALVKESAREELACRSQMKKWGYVDVTLGLMATGFAAIAGLSILTRDDLAIFGGIVALLAALSSAAYTWLGASKRRDRLAILLEGWSTLNGVAQTHLDFDLPKDEWIEGAAARDLRVLADRRASLVAGNVEETKTRLSQWMGP